jgi:hypothetical protein
VLLGWQTRYGSADLREVERKLLRKARDALNACRRLDRRRQQQQWQQLDCDAATRPGATQVSRRLRDQLRPAFDDYWAAVKPFM